MNILRNVHVTKLLFWRNWFLAVLVILLIEAFFHFKGSQFRDLALKPILLPVSLSNFPYKIGDWSGKDLPIPEFVQRATGNDDFIYRLFVHKPTGRWVTLYLAYSGRPRTMLGHRPEICYVADGWVLDNSMPWQFLSLSSRPIQCSIHRFNKQTLGYEESVVLNFYILNGQIKRNESEFSDLSWRIPNLAGNPAYYVTQVQISSVLENSVQVAANDMADLILDFFPDKNGETKAVEYIDTASVIN